MIGDYPKWVLQHKGKNVEIRKLKNHYYAYKIKSVWDKKKKRVKKVTLGYLGKITPEGIVPAKHKRELTINAVLEYGNVKLVHLFSDTITSLLKDYFPYTYESIMAAAIIRLIYQQPLKNLMLCYQTSYLKALYPDATMSAKKMSEIIHKLGVDYGSLLAFFKDLSKGKRHIAIDITTIFSESKNVTWAERGYNTGHMNRNQIQFLLMHSLDEQLPSFFKLLPGNVADVTTLINAVYESRLQNVILVTDRGFYAEYNIKELEDAALLYIIPLKRYMKCLTYANDETYKQYFLFRNRFIWYREYKHKSKRITQFLDKKLRQEEETTFLHHVDKGKKTLAEYHEQKTQFGVISILTNTDLPTKDVYNLYKKRIEIEVAFDAMKNSLDSDKTYMRSTESVRGYFFITFIALHLYSQILNHLRKKDLLKKYSVHDILMNLSKLYKIKLADKELTSEIPKKLQTILKQLDLPIT